VSNAATGAAVDVIIVNWNAAAQTLECLAALTPQLAYVSDGATVTVIDNGSTDGSIHAVKSQYPGVRLLPLGTNTGFTGGIAAGVARSAARNVAFVNNDAVPEPQWLPALVHAIDTAPDDVVSVGGRITSMDGALIDFIGGAMTFDGHAFQNGFRYATGSRREPAAGEELLFACGGNMITRRERYMALGGFDDDYFAYLEDVDFGWRTWISGGRAVFEPKACVRHHSSLTSERLGNFERGVLFERNALQTALKNYEDAAAGTAPVLFAYLHRLHAFTTTRNENAAELSRPFGTNGGKKRGRFGRKALATIDDPLTAMQFRALDWVMQHGARIAEKRAAVQALRRRPDADIFGRFPLLFVPTYPGDEALLRNPLFALLRSALPSEEKKLGDIMRT
jgi:GT2 family glycosyltransferase